jgi:hypothetical protein
MARDNRDPIEVLKAELDFIEKGGYGSSVRTPWRREAAFRDSLTCLNYAEAVKIHPCSDCLLIDFVPIEHRAEATPCHHIVLNDRGETVESLEARDGWESALKEWLRDKIAHLEEERAAAAR